MAEPHRLPPQPDQRRAGIRGGDPGTSTRSRTVRQVYGLWPPLELPRSVRARLERFATVPEPFPGIERLKPLGHAERVDATPEARHA